MEVRTPLSIITSKWNFTNIYYYIVVIITIVITIVTYIHTLLSLFHYVTTEPFTTPIIGKEWEIPRKRLNITRKLGEGAFGVVYEGTLSTGVYAAVMILFSCIEEIR